MPSDKRVLSVVATYRRYRVTVLTPGSSEVYLSTLPIHRGL